MEENSALAFLDTLTITEPDGNLKVKVYRKPTHTGPVLEIQIQPTIRAQAQGGASKRTTVGIPYVEGTTEEIKRVINSYDIKTYIKQTWKLKEILCVSLKIDWNQKKSVALFIRLCVEEAEVRNANYATYIGVQKDH